MTKYNKKSPTIRFHSEDQKFTYNGIPQNFQEKVIAQIFLNENFDRETQLSLRLRSLKKRQDALLQELISEQASKS